MAKSYKHRDKRPYIPSAEEEGYEYGNSKVQEKQTVEYPRNPVVHRGQDPELFWLGKYGQNDDEDTTSVDIRSLYRHEHIHPEALIQRLFQIKENAPEHQLDLFGSLGNEYEVDELEKVGEYYKHQNDWKNRLILGDSQLVMASLLEREGFAGKVQMIYFDPPYGIKYGSNWQVKLNNRTVKDGKDDHLSGEPEMIKAYRDTWELGIHSYLGYIRDRLLVAKELLTESGSCFVQISDENVHLLRCLMDEVFGSENFVSLITFFKTASQTSSTLSSTTDYIIWYAKSHSNLKFRQLYLEKSLETDKAGVYRHLEMSDGSRRNMTSQEKQFPDSIPTGSRIFRKDNMTSQSGGPTTKFDVELDGKICKPGKGFWKTNRNGIDKLIKKRRVIPSGKSLAYIRYLDDFPVYSISNLWTDTGTGSFTDEKKYVVQTGVKVIQRCLLMCTDPGDLVLDPTCGSGTTANVAEQWGRRWITIDTSRIALNIAKARLTTATFPYYYLYDSEEGQAYRRKVLKKEGQAMLGNIEASRQYGTDIRQGFVYKTVPHITLKALANDEPFDEETLYDQPYEDKSKLRVAGPFTVETLQSLNPVSPEDLQQEEVDENFEYKVFEHMRTAGVKTGRKEERATFIRIDKLGSEYLHAEGFYKDGEGLERKAYLHIGPKFGTVSKRFVNEAVKECRAKGDADWLLILGFSFEANIEGGEQTTSLGSFRVTKVRMHDDLLQEGLKKKPAKSAASFVAIGEPDIAANKLSNEQVQVKVRGLDIYDPIKDQVRSHDRQGIAYWMLDEDYDGSNFIVTQLFFCGGDGKEFKDWEKGISEMVKQSQRKRAESSLRIELDDEAFDRLYGYTSHPIELKRPGQRIAVRVVSQFGEESMKVVGCG